MSQSAPESLLAQLTPQLLSHQDANVRFFVDWWRRMHRNRRPLVAVALKFVPWSLDGAATQRFVWEVCRWPQGPRGRRQSEWTFVCWMIDSAGMWFKDFPSKRAAVDYFRRAPKEVMATP